MYQKFVARFNAASFGILLVICSLLPLIALPQSISGLGAVKGVVLYAGVFISFALWLIAQFIDGTLNIPKHRGILLLGGLVVLSLVSALASTNVTVSLWGRGFMVDSFATTLVLALLAFLVATYGREQRRLIKLFLGAFLGSVVTILLQVVLYVFGGTEFVATQFGHVATSGTLVGTWVDFAYFVTLTLVLSLLMVEVLAPRGFFKLLALVASILSLIVIVFLNFKTAWIITIISSLLIFVYKFSVERSLTISEHAEEAPVRPRFPILSFITLLIGLFFFLSSTSIGAAISRYAGRSFTDFRPSFGATTHIMRASFLNDPLFGAGAGRFGDVWNMYRSADVNQTIFWNTSFENGYSLFQTIATTQGALVGLLYVVLLVFAVLTGIKLFNATFPDRFTRFVSVMAFIMFSAFVDLFFFTTPGMILVVSGFMYFGLLIGVSVMVGRTELKSLQYLRDPRTSFFAILILVIATMASFTAAYFTGSRFAGVVYFNRALTATTFESSIAKINKAISLSNNDIYLRTRAALYSTAFRQTASAQNPDKTVLQSYFSQAEQSATAALSWDRTTSANWLAVSQIYQLLAGSSDEAYANAEQAAQEALNRNPNNPVILLNHAQLALTKKNTELALATADKAIALKGDYVDAYTFKAAIRSQAGDTAGAKAELQKYISLAPYDAQGYLLLGGLLLEAKDTAGAIEAFRQAHAVAPTNPNVHLQYINALVVTGNRSQAVVELKALQAQYPKIAGIEEEIKRIESNTSTQ